MTYTRFHILADGSSDSCPIQLSYTDNVPSQNPQQTVWTHTSVVPDDLGGTGVGESANQFSVPVVEKSGALDVAYVLEECNSSIDHGLRFQKSTDGGVSFMSQPVKVNKPGQWKDNPDAADLIPNDRLPRAEHRLAGLQPEDRHARLRLHELHLRRERTATSTSACPMMEE